MTENSQKDIDGLENKNKLLLSQVEYLTDELYKLRKNNEEEKKKHDEDMEAARSDITHMVKESIELKTKIQSLQDDLDDYEEEIISMVGNKSLKNENLALRKDIRTLTKELEDLGERYEMVRDEYNSALFEAEDLRKQFSIQKNDLLLKTNALERAWKDLERNNADIVMLMKENAEMKQQDDTPTNWKEMESDNRRLKSELDAVTRHNETMTLLLSELRMEISRINEMNTGLPDLTDVGDPSIKEKVNSETLETHGVITTIFTPEDVSSSITLLLNSLSVMITDFSESETQELIRRVSSLMLLKKQLIAINDEAIVFTNRDDQHREALMKEEMKVEELEQQIRNLQRMNDNLTNQISSKSSDAHLTIQQLKEKDEEITELKKQIRSLSDTSSSNQSSLESKEKQIESMRLSTISQIEELENTKRELTKETIELQHQITVLKGEVSELEEENKSNEKTISTQKQLLELREKSIEELSKKVESLSTLSSQLRSTNDQSTTQNVVTVNQLKKDIADRDKKIQELEDELEDEKDDNDDKDEEIEKLRKQLKEIAESRDVLRSELKCLDEENIKLSEELEKSNESNKRYLEKEKDYLERLHEKDELQNKVLILQQQVIELKAYNKAKDQDIPQCERVDGPIVVYDTAEDVSEYAQAVASAPEESDDIVELCFKGCNLDDGDIDVVRTAFEYGGFANVRRVNVSGNHITFKYWIGLLQAMADRKSLDDFNSSKKGKQENEKKNLIQVLNLSNNQIKPKAFMYLVQRINEGRFPMLWELDVSNCELNDDCVRKLTGFVRSNPKASSLHLVNFDNNGISSSVLQDFKTALAASYS